MRGQTGMDLYWDKATPAQQEESFEAHLILARDLDKPVIVLRDERLLDGTSHDARIDVEER